MHYVTLVLSALFFLALGHSLPRNDLDNAAAQIILGTVLFVCSVIFRRDKKYHMEFTDWIRRNHLQIMTEGAEYDGVLIDRDTEFRQYQACLSIGFLSFRLKSGYYIKEYSLTPLLNLLFTTFTMLGGWWSIPFGPVYTIRAILNNLFGKTKKIDQILNEIV
jgi:hypothetical protein